MHDVRVAGGGAHEDIRLAYEQTGDRLWRAIRSYSGADDIADEAVAEAFVQALGRGEALRDPSAWIWKSAFAIARGLLAQRFPAAGDAPGETAIDRPSQFDQLAPLLKLSHNDREVLVLRHVAGYTPLEISRLIAISPVAVRVRLHRATSRARELLEEGHVDE